MGVVVMGHDFEVVWEIRAPVVGGGGVMCGSGSGGDYWNGVSSELFRIGDLDGGDNCGDGYGVFEIKSRSSDTCGVSGNDVGVFSNCERASRGGIREGAL